MYRPMKRISMKRFTLAKNGLCSVKFHHVVASIASIASHNNEKVYWNKTEDSDKPHGAKPNYYIIEYAKWWSKPSVCLDCTLICAGRNDVRCDRRVQTISIRFTVWVTRTFLFIQSVYSVVDDSENSNLRNSLVYHSVAATKWQRRNFFWKDCPINFKKISIEVRNKNEIPRKRAIKILNFK